MPNGSGRWPCCAHSSVCILPAFAAQRRRRAVGVPAIIALLIGLTATAACPGQNPLRYRLGAGDRLVYEGRTVVTALDGGVQRSSRTEQVEIWLLQQDAGQMLVLLAVQPAAGKQDEPAVGLPFYMDEAGRRRLTDEVARRFEPLEAAVDVLPPLPLAVESTAAWVSPPDLYQVQWRCLNQGPDVARQGQFRVELVVEDQTGVRGFLDRQRSGQFWFDPVAGYLTRLETVERDQGRGTSTTVTVALRQKLTHSSVWAARRAEEAGRFLRALRHEDRLLHEIITRPDQAGQTLEQLDQLWSAFKSDVDARAGSPFHWLADARRQQVRANAGVLYARAAVGRRWIGRPARTWTLQEATGRTLTSESARQGVVIECFWSAESVWGLRALESFRQLQALPAIRPPRVLCFNTDFDIGRVQQAIEHCGGGLTQILGGPLQDVEALPELPVVRVLDRRGIVRDVWIGWEPDFAAAWEAARQLIEGVTP